jgi:hypothetical protein
VIFRWNAHSPTRSMIHQVLSGFHTFEQWAYRSQAGGSRGGREEEERAAASFRYDRGGMWQRNDPSLPLSVSSTAARELAGPA